MKKVLTLLVLTTLFCVASIDKADARIRIPIGSYEKIKKVMDLPDEEDYVTTSDDHFDLGVKYTVYQICFIPVWTEASPELVGYVSSETYVPFDEEDLGYIAEMNNIANIEKLAKMPFWDAWGGKVIALIIIGVILYGYFGKSSDDEEETEAAA